MSKDNTQGFKLNLVDVFIIALIVCCIFTVLLRLLAFKKEDSAEYYEEYIISFKAENVRSTSLDYFVEGDIARIKSKNKILGRLTGAVTHNLAVGEYTENGEMLYPEIDGNDPEKTTRYTVRGDILTRGEMTPRGLLIDSGVYISPNYELVLITEHIEIGVRIMSIEPKLAYQS